MSTFVLMYFFSFFCTFCTFVIYLDYPYELPCKIWSLQLKKWLSYCTRYEREHLLLYIYIYIYISSVDYTVQTFFAKVLKFGQYVNLYKKLLLRYTWEKNGKPFNWQVYDERISQQPGRGTLVITSPKTEDIGRSNILY